MTKKIYSVLPKGIKAKWVAALRSGKFKQAEGVLKTNIRKEVGPHQYETVGAAHCCLGVLSEIKKIPCEITDNGNNYDFKYEKFPDNDPYGPGYFVSECQPPEGFCGLNENSIGKLAKMNDSGKSFKYIAGWIERYL